MEHDWLEIETGYGYSETEIFLCKRCNLQKRLYDQNVPCGAVTRTYYVPKYRNCVRSDREGGE